MSESHQSLIGKPAPPITLPNHDGKPFTFTPGTKGIPAAIFFYPQSSSYGCTQQACQMKVFAEKGIFGKDRAEIIGISTDSVEKQKAFVEKEKLTYPVLSDENEEAVKAYKVGSGMMGYVPYARTTYIIDKHGIVRDTLDATMNYGAHSKFVDKWFEKLDKEDNASATL